jgi:4'-phosphopantetheinyl transferase
MQASQINIYVWKQLADKEEFGELQNLLSPLEHERAGKFAFERDRRRFIISHGRMRKIIGRHIGANPRKLTFSTAPHGKPFLTGGKGPFFNLSHSHDLACLALSDDFELGLDVEKADQAPRENIEQFFSAREIKELSRLKGDEKTEGFFNCWTRKEAFIKALGHGLFMPLDSFSVSLAPGQPARLLHMDGDHEAPDKWRIFSFEPAPNHIGALAVSCTHADCRIQILTI